MIEYANEEFKKESMAVPEEKLVVQDWGLIDYQEAFKRQMDLADLVHHELARETLVVCSHPPVVTLGRGTKEGDVDGWSGEIVEINRGGRATYHGPSQLVVYPILDLNHRSRDLHLFLRLLETAIVNTLAEHGISATGRSEEIEATGVWVGPRKLASIGIGVRKWTTFHGLALNVEHDPQAFRGLRPCGFSPETMTSMEEILGRKPDREQVKASLVAHLRKLLN